MGSIAVVFSLVAPSAARAATTGGGATTRYVMMGDSYSSGEGVDPVFTGGYYTDSNQPMNDCHRSNLAYGPLVTKRMAADSVIGGSEWSFTACSGDTSADMMTRSPRDRLPGAVAQLSSLNGDVRHVTLTAGGNDVGFESVLRACDEELRGSSRTADPKACDRELQRASTAIGPSGARGGVGDQLAWLYREILVRAPNAHVTVLTYPRIFPDLGEYTPTKAAGLDYCRTANMGRVPSIGVDLPFLGHRQTPSALWFHGFAVTTTELMAGLEDRLNDKIEQVVNRLRGQGLAGRISVVRIDTHPSLREHTIDCGDSHRPAPYVSGGLISAQEEKQLSRASFHPNEAGHAAFAGVVYETARTRAAALALAVGGPSTVAVGEVAVLVPRATDGSPRWAPSTRDAGATPVYEYELVGASGDLAISRSGDTWTAGASSAGTYHLTFRVRDAAGATADEAISIHFGDTPAPVPTAPCTTQRIVERPERNRFTRERVVRVGYAYGASISDDGNTLVYAEISNNSSEEPVFHCDVATGAMSRVEATLSDGSGTVRAVAPHPGFAHLLTPDGRYLLARGSDTSDAPRSAVLFDLLRGEATEVRSGGRGVNDCTQLAADGSWAACLLSEIDHANQGYYSDRLVIVDIANGTHRRVSAIDAEPGAVPYGATPIGTVSPSGRYAVYTHQNLETQRSEAAVIRDTTTGEITRIPVIEPEGAGYVLTRPLAISDDGRSVTLATTYAMGGDGYAMLSVYDRDTGIVREVARNVNNEMHVAADAGLTLITHVEAGDEVVAAGYSAAGELIDRFSFGTYAEAVGAGGGAVVIGTRLDSQEWTIATPAS